ncbi:MAG: ATPase, T2SS/T4P/T4SS family [Planctomycetota bacterium]
MVSADDWASARDTGQPIIDVLIERELMSEASLFETLGLQANVPPMELARCVPDKAAIDSLPRHVCEEHCVIPIARVGDNLTVAVADPYDVLLLDDLNILSRCKVRPVLSHPKAIREALVRAYDDAGQKVADLLSEVGHGEIEVQREETDELEIQDVDDDEVPAVKLVNLILLKALREKASDIHIEPGDAQIRVRYRVDGRLIEALRTPKSILPALSSRLKILASLDIAIRHEPQDGKFQIRFEGRTVDFRLSILPVVGGEKAVMRILDQSGAATTLDDLGFEPSCLSDFRAGISSAYGMVLVTGPTGSGKSTTLYSAVKEISTPEINVITVEDPVEYQMEGINQVPVNPKRGLTFAGALRSILRQDPDVVLVGEIRDKETAEIAIKAALTGHLVLSTLHTNDAPSAVTRLIDMGIDPFMVSSSLVSVAAQRLVRRLCKYCRVPLEIEVHSMEHLGVSAEEVQGATLFEPEKNGCSRCSNGYRGRLAILEVLQMTSEIKRLVIQGKSAAELKVEALAGGMMSLRQVGLQNVLRGHTSIEEVLRVTVAD